MKTIYIRTNLVNGKQYVGQTRDPKQRDRAWKCLKIQYANQPLTEDREKYGLDNFKSDILKECDDSEGDYWEQYYIKEYNTKYPNGYNISNGGIGAFGVIRSEDTRKKLSESHIGNTSAPRKKVYQYTMSGELVKIWNSTSKCGKNGFSQGIISECCNGKRKYHKNYIWKYD